jgi:hypothetical protein
MNDDEDERMVHGRASTTSMPRIETMNVEQARVAPPTCCRQDAGSTLGFMESFFSFFRMHWEHEPRDVPRRTESAAKSDALL